MLSYGLFEQIHSCVWIRIATFFKSCWIFNSHILKSDVGVPMSSKNNVSSLPAVQTKLKRYFSKHSVRLYTGSLWSKYAKKSLNTLRIQYNNIFRMLLKLPRFCSASEMFAQAHTVDFPSLLRKKIVSLMRQLRESDNSILKVVADDLHAPMRRHFVRVMTCLNNNSSSGVDSSGVPRRYMIY